MCYKYTVNHWKHSLHRAYSLFIMHIGNEVYINAQSLFIIHIQSNLTSSYSGQTMGCICFLSVFFSRLWEIHKLADWLIVTHRKLNSNRQEAPEWDESPNRTILHADEYAFVPAYAFFFFFSEEYMCSLVPQSSTMCIMYAIDCCSSPTGLISRSRWRNGCRCSSNQTCNHRYYSYAWRVLKRTISVLYKLGQLKPSLRALWLDSAFRNRTSSFMGWILLSEMVLKWSFTYYDWCVIKYFGGFDISNCRETA